ncbi:MAG: hypothetical protein KatS3mg121_0844 [Gammaproteobacteria bacterium]|nr:MAG: hypothetical protein KatS3mg121_0844 [Gammaproteobacteria bacterium]
MYSFTELRGPRRRVYASKNLLPADRFDHRPAGGDAGADEAGTRAPASAAPGVEGKTRAAGRPPAVAESGRPASRRDAGRFAFEAGCGLLRRRAFRIFIFVSYLNRGVPMSFGRLRCFAFFFTLAALAACKNGGGGDGPPPVDASSSSAASSGSVAAGADPDYRPPPAGGPGCRADNAAIALARAMGVGWNLGNSLEALNADGTPEETAWGNPPVTRAFLQAVWDAGFRSLRLPVAWSRFSDPSTYTIDPAWLDRVQEVVDWALDIGFVVIVNEHWDGGWLQPTYAARPQASERLRRIWEQVAARFRDYPERLLFAGTNEVMVEGDWGPPTEEYCEVQNGYNQLFVDTVRASGGGNAQRYLVVQGFNTNIDYTLDCNTLPQDTVSGRLMMEVHYYDPYPFTLQPDSDVTQWGGRAYDPARTAGWGDEDWVERQFGKIREAYADRGVPVILGEYGTVARLGDAEHALFRLDWYDYVTRSALSHCLVPMVWDNGAAGADDGMGLFDRTTGEPVHPELIAAVVGAATD